MRVELKILQNKRKELTKEFELLNEKEQVLVTKTQVLEGMLEIQRRIEKPEQFGRAQRKLETLEGFVEKKDWSKDSDLQARPMTPVSRGNQLVTTNETLTSKVSKLNRVRLKRNSIFSWSYEKLS